MDEADELEEGEFPEIIIPWTIATLDDAHFYFPETLRANPVFFYSDFFFSFIVVRCRGTRTATDVYGTNSISDEFKETAT